jgi:hypothetical protein
MAIDAFTIPWGMRRGGEMFAYAFPPTFLLVPRTLQKIQDQDCTVILIAPFWPKRSWFPGILDLLIDRPFLLLNRADLLRQPRGKLYHPLAADNLHLTASLLFKDVRRQHAFLTNLRGWWTNQSAFPSAPDMCPVRALKIYLNKNKGQLEVHISPFSSHLSDLIIHPLPISFLGGWLALSLRHMIPCLC